MTDTPESAIVALLKADAGVAGVVADRVWPNARPQGKPYPSITVTRISGSPEYADDGEAGLMISRIQVSNWALTYSEAKELGLLTVAALSPGFDVVQGSITFIYIMLDNEQDLHEFGANNAEYAHQVAQDFMAMTKR